MNIWKKLFGKKNEGNGSIFPEIKQYPPMPPVVEPEVIEEPASLIIKALQDDGLDWEYSTESGACWYTEILYSSSKDYRITVKHAYNLEYLICPGSSSFSGDENRAVIAGVKHHVRRVIDKMEEQERLATIELFKEYREE